MTSPSSKKTPSHEHAWEKIPFLGWLYERIYSHKCECGALLKTNGDIELPA